jgi:hypothetical protein
MKMKYHASAIVLAVLTSACGGRVDVAKVDREQGRVNSSETGDGGASSEVARDYSDYDPACYAAEYTEYWDTDAPNYYFTVLPNKGCTYHFTGNDDNCEGTWTCCNNTYNLRYERDLDAKVATTYVTSSLEGAGGYERWDESEQTETVPPSNSPSKLVPCRLKDETSPELSEVAAIAADWFGYTPAWEQAVREERGETVAPGALDPMPLGCSLWLADNGCQARLTCREHEYEVRTGLDGELSCTRDGETVTPVSEPYEIVSSCNAENIGSLQADACFGPGWASYFEFAARSLE